MAPMRRRPPRLRSDPAAPAARRSLLEVIPAWVQAFAALLGLVVTVFGIGYVANRDNDAGERNATGAEVRVLSTSVGDAVGGTGEYLRLRSDEEEILLLVRLEGDDQWTPIEVSREPSSVDEAAGLEDGTWTAEAPLRATTATFLPVVIRSAGLGLDAPSLDELRAEGADASLVVASGAPVEATPAP